MATMFHFGGSIEISRTQYSLLFAKLLHLIPGLIHIFRFGLNVCKNDFSPYLISRSLRHDYYLPCVIPSSIHFFIVKISFRKLLTTSAVHVSVNDLFDCVLIISLPFSSVLNRNTISEEIITHKYLFGLLLSSNRKERAGGSEKFAES